MFAEYDHVELVRAVGDIPAGIRGFVMLPDVEGGSEVTIEVEGAVDTSGLLNIPVSALRVVAPPE